MVANSFGIKLFKTECISELPFEQFRVMLHAMDYMNKEIAKTAIDSKAPISEGRENTTFRITSN